MKRNRRPDSEPALPPTEGDQTVPMFDECDPIPGEVTFSVLHADPSRPWGFTRTPFPFEHFEDGWADD